MALLDSEIARAKFELGFNLLSSGAEPYIGVAAIFEQVIQVYMMGGASTTSATAVTAATTPAPVTLTLTSATGFTSGARVVIDVDERQEVVTIQSLSGTSMTVQLRKTHSGTYPVTVEGGESIVRELLRNIASVKAEMSSVFGEGAVQRVDEIWFYQTKGSTTFGNLGEQLSAWRDELAAAFGIRSMWGAKRAAAQRCSVY